MTDSTHYSFLQTKEALRIYCKQQRATLSPLQRKEKTLQLLRHLEKLLSHLGTLSTLSLYHPMSCSDYITSA